ncbi:TPA: AAA family ATPase [Vibrio diabolicus]|nr:AAA family ATPase [Vibrio parahaemolyticus]
MIVSIKNFGPVREFSLDLNKDFHLLVGKNNIGKSYAITAVYLIVKALHEVNEDTNSFGIRPIFFAPEFNVSEDIIKKISKEAVKLEHGREKDITKYIKEMFISNFQGIFEKRLLNSFTNTFNSLDNLRSRFSDEKPTFSLFVGNMGVIFEVLDNAIIVKDVELNKKYFVKKSKQNRTPLEKTDKNIVYFCEEKEDEFFNLVAFDIAYRKIFQFINTFNRVIKTVHYLPASRSGLYQALSAFGQIIAELSKNRSFLSKKVELPGISEPVSDYFIKLSDIKVKKKSFENKNINAIAKDIEQKILKGKVEFNSQTKQLMFHPNDTDLKLELSSTSSMVSELAPIVSYLRYVLTENSYQSTMIPHFRPRRTKRETESASHLIMIEEPEAHLHPEVQLQLTEIFSKLAKADVKLIITSHSNYIFNKVNNLIMSKELDVDKVYSGVFKSTVKGSVVNSLEIDELGVEDDNFSEPTSHLFEEKMKIIDELNSEDR